MRLCSEANIRPLIADKRDKHNKALTSRFEHVAPEKIPTEADSVNRMKLERQTKEGKELYAKRKSTVEPVFGIIKHAMKFRQFSLRGHEAVSGEWTLVTIAWNLKRMFKLQSDKKAPMETINTHRAPNIAIAEPKQMHAEEIITLAQDIIMFLASRFDQKSVTNRRNSVLCQA